jgi:hypothetical protein
MLLADDGPEVLALTRLMLVHCQADVFTAPSAPTLYAYSPYVIPVPSDWNEKVLKSGFGFLDSANPKLPRPAVCLSKTGE